MQLVILEGTDGVGKTTLCNKFFEKFHGQEHFYFWQLGLKGEGSTYANWQEYLAHLLSFSGLTNDSVVITDRSFIGNYIYGTMMKDKTHIEQHDIYMLLKWLSRTFDEIHINLMRCSEEKLTKTFEERGDDYVTLDQALEAQKEYVRTLYGILNKPKIEGLTVHFRQIDGDLDTIYELIESSLCNDLNNTSSITT